METWFPDRRFVFIIQTLGYRIHIFIPPIFKVKSVN